MLEWAACPALSRFLGGAVYNRPTAWLCVLSCIITRNRRCGVSICAWPLAMHQ
jgi:hypothetical protein